MRIGRIATRALAAVVLAAAGQAAMALEFGVEAAASNLQLPWTPLAPLAPAVGSHFPVTNYFWGGQAWMVAPLGDDAFVRLSYERDPVTRNSAIAAVQFERGIARISVGPLIGFLNSASVPISAGISASVRLQWPGVAYVSMRSDGGTAVSVFQADSDPQARTEFAAGFYVPNAIVSGLLSAKRFSELDSGGSLVTDSLTRYAMTIDVFKKNVPYTALFSLGYELRSKHYAASDVTDSLGAVVLGLDTTMQLSRPFRLVAGISTGAYVFGLDALTGFGPLNSSFLFSANLGLSVDTAELKFSPRPKPAKAEEPKAAEKPAPDAEKPATAASEEKPAAEKPAKPATGSKLALDLGAGINYNDRISATGSFALFAAILNARAGAWGSIGYRFTPAFSLGAEVGFDFITLNSSGISLTLYDLPIRANVRYMFGKIGVEAFGGTFVNGVAANGTGLVNYVDMDAGARLRLGGFYAEASYVFAVQSTSVTVASLGGMAASYPRYGLGYAFRLF